MLFFHKLFEKRKSEDEPGIFIMERAVLEVDAKKCADLGLPVEIPHRGLETIIYDGLLPITDPLQSPNYESDHLIALINCMRPNGTPYSGSLGMFLPTDWVYFERLKTSTIPTPPLSVKPKLHLVVPPSRNDQAQAHLPLITQKKLDHLFDREVDIDLEVFFANKALPGVRGVRDFISEEILPRLNKKFPLDGNKGQNHYFSIADEPQQRGMDLYFQDKINSDQCEVTLSIFAKDGVRTFRPTPSDKLLSSDTGGYLQYSIRNLANHSTTKFILTRTYGPGNFRWVDLHSQAGSDSIDAAYATFSRLADLSLVWIIFMAIGNFSAPEDGVEPIPDGISATLKWIQDRRVECVDALPSWRSMLPTAIYFPHKADRPFDVQFPGHHLGVEVVISVDPRNIKEVRAGSELAFQLKVYESSEEIKLEYNSRSSELEKLKKNPFQEVDGWKTLTTWTLKAFILEYHAGLALLVSHSVSWLYRRRSSIALPLLKVRRLIKFAKDPTALIGIDSNEVVVAKSSFSNGQLQLKSLHPGRSYELMTQRFRSHDSEDRQSHRLQVGWHQIDFGEGIKPPRNCQVLTHASLVRGSLQISISPPETRPWSKDVIMRTEAEIESWQTTVLLPAPSLQLRLLIAPLSKNLTASLKYFLNAVPSEWQIYHLIKVSEFITVQDQVLMNSFLTEATFQTIVELLRTAPSEAKTSALQQLTLCASEILEVHNEGMKRSSSSDTVIEIETNPQVHSDFDPSEIDPNSLSLGSNSPSPQE